MNFLIKTFLITTFTFLIILPANAQEDSSGTCTCTMRGEQKFVMMDMGMGMPKSIPAGYDWKELDEPKIFKDIDSNECSGGEHKVGDFVNYKNCTFELTNPTVTSLADEFNISEPKLEINWPGLNFTPADQSMYTDAYGRRYLQMPWLAEFIENLYTFALGIVSILAIVMIIIEGIKIILVGTSIIIEGEKNTTASRLKNIARIMIGLFIAWTSYIILYQINPDLIKFQILQVEYIEEVDMPVDLTTGDNEGELGNIFPENWKPFANLSNLKYSQNKAARADIVEHFTTAVTEYGKTVNLNSAGRSPQAQYNIMVPRCGCPKNIDSLPSDIKANEWYKYCTNIELKNGKPVKSARCKTVGTYISRKNGVLQGPLSSHIAGNAVDINAPPKSNISCKSTGDEKVLKSNGVINAGGKSKGYCIPEEQQKLIGIMIKNGFCVGLNSKSNLREPWHFEYLGNELRISGFCVPKKADIGKIDKYPNLKKLEYIGI